MAEVTIPDEEMADLFSARILDALSGGTKEAMIEAALKYLLSPGSSVLGTRSKSRMQDAFEIALNRMANKLAEEVIAEQGVSEKLKLSMATLLHEIPDIAEDYELQIKVFKVLFDHAHQKGREEGRRGY